jgi:hypothetical protein
MGAAAEAVTPAANGGRDLSKRIKIVGVPTEY